MNPFGDNFWPLWGRRLHSATPDDGRPDSGSGDISMSTQLLPPGTAHPEDFIKSPRLRRLYEYWYSRRLADRPPHRNSIDPLDIPRLLPIVFLVEVKTDPLMFRFRLVGSEFVRKYGRDFTGLTLDQVNRHGNYEAIRRDYCACTERLAPVVSRHSSVNDHGIYWNYERILMPLIDEDNQVNMILGGMDIEIPRSEIPKLDQFRRTVYAGQA